MICWELLSQYLFSVILFKLFQFVYAEPQCSGEKEPNKGRLQNFTGCRDLKKGEYASPCTNSVEI